MTKQDNITPFEATHPGILIQDELVVREDLKQKDLAKELGVKSSFLNEIIKGKRPISADIAILLEQILDIPASYWLKFQAQYDIDKARIKEKNIKRIENVKLWSIIKKLVPTNFFSKNKYLNGNLEEDIAVIKSIYQINDITKFNLLFDKNKFNFYRKSDKLKISEKNIFAWSSLALFEAKSQKIKPFSFDGLEQLCLDLNRVFYTNSNTLNHVKETLHEYGIKFILINKLEKTPVDGFSFWSQDNPAIALTLRHNRIDNFAFTLMHEIAHVFLHLKNNKTKQFLDLTKKENIDIFEKEADEFAQAKLIKKDIWEAILANYQPLNDDKIIAISRKFEINPAIILGRVCYQMNDYAYKTRIDKKLK